MSALHRVLCLSVLLFAVGVCVVANSEPSDAEPLIPESDVDGLEESGPEQIPITATPEDITNTNDKVDDNIGDSVEKLSEDDEEAADLEAVARDNGYGNKSRENPGGQDKKKQKQGEGKNEDLAENRLNYLAKHGHIALPKGGLTGKAAHVAVSKLHSDVKTTLHNAVKYPSEANHAAVTEALKKRGLAKLHAHLKEHHKTKQPEKAAQHPTKANHGAGKPKPKQSKAKPGAHDSKAHHSAHPKGAQAG